MTAKLKKQFCEKARVLRQTQITRWKCIRNVTASPNAKDEEKGTLLKSIYELPEVGDITLFTRSVLLKSTKTTVHMAHKYFKHLLFTGTESTHALPHYHHSLAVVSSSKAREHRCLTEELQCGAHLSVSALFQSSGPFACSLAVNQCSRGNLRQKLLIFRSGLDLVSICNQQCPSRKITPNLKRYKGFQEGMYPFNTSKTLDPSPEDPTSESSPDQASLKDESMGF
ncbi:hypothetical protein MG293_007963 [Ovis ammon polii]|uniref:Uncharacterized protein n=1 Tax=Ovis ammon polii TaxID=230172 RepID=A0AAD4UE64_OVIAM|nr:hypothetical protein MG293_007963 [Ovis ammon polii]